MDDHTPDKAPLEAEIISSVPKQAEPADRSQITGESPRKTYPWITAGIFALIFIALGFLSGRSTTAEDMLWYRALQAPPGLPPSWVFPVVWTILYALMGLSLAILIFAPEKNRGGEHETRRKLKACLLFAIQLALNLAWTPVFFSAQLKIPALVIIIALLATIFLTIRAFFPISKRAAFLLIPYLIWVAYATYLNASFVILNL